MNLKHIELNEKLRQLQTKKQGIQKDLVALNNDIASKKEYLATNEVDFCHNEQSCLLGT